MMNEQEMMREFQKPFAANEVEWRVQRCGVSNGKPWAFVLCYLTNRAIQNRLDEVAGLANWRNEFTKWGEKSTLCGISIRIGGEWITKYDGASETDIEAVKGGFSDSMKRAAVQWGMGRYLYNLTENFAICSFERQNGPEWNRATADGKPFYWKAPALPDWALPGHSDGGKAPAGMTTGQTQKASPQAPAQPQNGQNQPSPRATAEERAALLVKFMQSLGVQREEIEAAIGARVEEFTPQETGIVRDAAKIMKARNVDFQTAVTEVTR